MIASKLILFFCFYLLLLDNSLGKQSLVKQSINSRLFQDAMDFGATYRGELGELASHWKQLLIELVQAKRKVGLGRAQLAIFNDSATAATEEVDLALNDNYADRVAELVEIRSQDIGTTQKYVDDLEILKNEIALTMIVKMDEIEEKFKEKNVRRKVKEAKANGITDTDIKELLFADFTYSGGLSLLGAAASTADELLSSFLYGMEILLDRKYDKILGILEYGNVIGSCLPFGNCLDGDGRGSNGAPGGDGSGSNGAPGSPPKEGRGPSGAAGGDEPPEGGGDPQRGPLGKDEDDSDPEDDDDDDDDDTPEEDDVAQEGAVGGQKEAGVDLVEAGIDPGTGGHEFTEANELEINVIVERRTSLLFAELDDAERILSDLKLQRANGYAVDSSIQFPLDTDVNETDRLVLYRRRVDHFRDLLQNTVNDLIDRNERLLNEMDPRYKLARQNANYYARRLKGEIGSGDNLVAPEELFEFGMLTVDNDKTRYELSARLWHQMYYIEENLPDVSESLIAIRDDLLNKIEETEKEINNLLGIPPNSTPTPTVDDQSF